MNKQFVTYEIALALKELGFNEECLADFSFISKNIKMPNGDITSNNEFELSAPLWQQAWKFVLEELRERYPIASIELFGDGSGNLNWIDGVLIENFNSQEKGILRAIEIIKERK